MTQALLTPMVDFEPPDVSGLLAWWDAARGVTKDGSNNVSSWLSRVNGYDAVQATGANKPTFTASHGNFGGAPAITFDPTSNDQYLTCDALASAFSGSDKPFTVFTVYDKVGTGDIQTLYAWGNANANTPYCRSYLRIATPRVQVYRRGDVATPVGNLAASGGDVGARIRCDVFHGTTLDVYEGGGTPLIDGGAFDVGVMTVDRFTIGALGRVVYANGFEGKLAHLLVYDSALTAASINLIGDYLFGRTGLTHADVS